MDSQANDPKVASVEELNRLARRRDWFVEGDVECRFIFGEHNKLDAIWRSKSGVSGIPFRREMTLRLLQPFSKMMVLHERVVDPAGTRRYRVRLIGSQAAQVIGEVSGKFYDEFLPQNSAAMWNAMSDAVLAQGTPIRMLIRADELDKSFLFGEFFVAPLMADDGTVSLIMSVGHFTGDLRWEDVASKTRD
jgi:hypothetical protein